jgi:hypothetical protein
MSRPRQRIPLEKGLKLDLNLLVRRGLFRSAPVLCASISWVNSGNVRASGLILGHLSARRGSMWVHLGPLEQSVDLVAVPRNFGGVQWFFVCPIMRCHASVLWMPPGARQFACRQTWGRQVAYASQFQTRHQRALRGAQGLRYRLGGEEFTRLDDFPPPKPRGMHQRTYEARMERLKAYEARFDLYVEKLISRSDTA